MLLLHSDGPSLFGYDLPRLHAVANDFPAALLVAAVIFEIAFLVTKRDSLRVAAYWTLLAGVLGAGLAILTGLLAEDHIAHGRAIHEIMEEHEELAYFTGGIFGVVAVWRLLRERTMQRVERIAALVLALVGTGVLISTGWHGGELMFDHAAGVSNENLERELKNRAAGHEHGDDDDEDHDHEQPADSTSGPAPAP